MLRNLLFILMLSLLAACEVVPPGREPIPALEGNWSVKLTQSGGFVGLLRTVTITNVGKLVAVDERANQAGTSQLSTWQLAELEAQLASAAFVRPASAETGCADCFLYDLVIKTDRASFSAHLDDVTLPDSGLQALLMYLGGLMEEALQA